MPVSGRGERSQVWGSSFRWRGAVSGGGERSQVGGNDRRWREAVSGGVERSLVEGMGCKITYIFFNFASNTVAMESLEAKTCSDHLCCCI